MSICHHKTSLETSKVVRWFDNGKLNHMVEGTESKHVWLPTFWPRTVAYNYCDSLTAWILFHRSAIGNNPFKLHSDSTSLSTIQGVNIDFVECILFLQKADVFYTQRFVLLGALLVKRKWSNHHSQLSCSRFLFFPHSRQTKRSHFHFSFSISSTGSVLHPRLPL